MSLYDILLIQTVTMTAHAVKIAEKVGRIVANTRYDCARNEQREYEDSHQEYN